MHLIWILLLSLLLYGTATAEVIKINTKHLPPKQVEQLYKLQKIAYHRATLQREAAQILAKLKKSAQETTPQKSKKKKSRLTHHSKPSKSTVKENK